MIPVKIYQQRRAKFAQQIKNGIAVIPTAPELMRNADSNYPYRFDSHFYYLTGFTEAEAVVVILAGKNPRSILFCREKNKEREIWDGFRYGPIAAKKAFGFDEAYPIDSIDKIVPELLANQAALATPMGFDAAWDKRVMGWLNEVRAQARKGVTPPAALIDSRSITGEMRLFKDDYELQVMQRAADISVSAHMRAMQKTRAGKWEHEIEAELLHEFRRFGSQAPAYTSIVAGGGNACVLHYIDNNQRLQDGDLLLIDAGCEVNGYASDITRTWPVNGKFSGPQKDVYEIVLEAQMKSIAAVKPGAVFQTYYDVSLKTLVRGLIDLKLCKGSVDKVIAKKEYTQFYMHSAGHWLGLDVHDTGDYKAGTDKRESRKLQAGMVLTVEPGLYIRPAKNVPAHFNHIGIRIEDDVLVTKTGNRVLTEQAPKKVEDIEAWMAAA
jgi:Xaa-Pro aminopeptidase